MKNKNNKKGKIITIKRGKCIKPRGSQVMAKSKPGGS